MMTHSPLQNIVFFRFIVILSRVSDQESITEPEKQLDEQIEVDDDCSIEVSSLHLSQSKVLEWKV